MYIISNFPKLLFILAQVTFFSFLSSKFNFFELCLLQFDTFAWVILKV